MTEYELTMARSAFHHALNVGAPGVSEGMRNVIVNNAVLRMRHQLNIPAPRLDTSPQTAE